MNSKLFVVPVVRPHKLFIFSWVVSSPRILLQCVCLGFVNFYLEGEACAEPHVLPKRELAPMLSPLF